MVKAVFARSIDLAKEGKIQEAVGVGIGQLLGPGILEKELKVAAEAGRVGEVAAAARVGEAADAVQAARVAEAASLAEASQAARATEAASVASRTEALAGATEAAGRVEGAAAEATAAGRSTSAAGAAATEGTQAVEGAGTLAPEAGPEVTEITLGNGDVVYKVDELGRTLEVDARISGPHRGRAKGPRPDPPGGLVPGEHRGHLAPEGGVDDPSLVNVPENIISEAPGSNLGPKKSFDYLLSRIAAENPSSVVRGRHKPLFRPGDTRPYAVEHMIVVDGKTVHTVVIPNR
jgi:hypothetical protein